MKSKKGARVVTAYSESGVANHDKLCGYKEGSQGLPRRQSLLKEGVVINDINPTLGIAAWIMHLMLEKVKQV